MNLHDIYVPPEYGDDDYEDHQGTTVRRKVFLAILIVVSCMAFFELMTDLILLGQLNKMNESNDARHRSLILLTISVVINCIFFLFTVVYTVSQVSGNFTCFGNRIQRQQQQHYESIQNNDAMIVENEETDL